MSNPLPPDIAGIQAHYADGYEETRVTRDGGTLEMVRMQELARRFLPPAPAVIYDVGGGPGAYALWLARLGYTVHLLDALPLHVELARQASDAQPEAPLASATPGDARHLPWPDASADAVLLFGPLYHLTERADRIQALREARRVARHGGVILAVGISRFAALLDGLFLGYLEDPAFVEIVGRELTDGQHRNPTDNQRYFTTAYFHLPDELRGEAEEAGLRHEATLAIEGSAWRSPLARERWGDPAWRERILEATRRVEGEPSLLGASAHLMAVARRE
jgi:SAM-dependent methyltransferase